MGLILNRNQKKKEPSNEEIEQNADDINNTDNFWRNVVDSLYLARKRKKPDGDGKNHSNEINGNAPSETIRLKDLLQKKT